MSRIPLGMNMTLDVFDAPVIVGLSRMSEKLGSSIGEILRSRAPTLARYLATATMPIAGLAQDGGRADGYSLAAKKIGEKAVTRDISRVYKSPLSVTHEIANSNGKNGKNMAKGFTKYMKTGEFEKAKAILNRAKIEESRLIIVQWDGGATHKKVRNARGRVSNSRTPSISTDAKALREYSDMRRRNVGFAKRGWLNGARSISALPKSTPAWLLRGDAPGYASDMTNDPIHPRFELSNQVNYMTKIMDEKYLIMATASFDRSLKKEIKIVLEYLAKKESN